MITFPRKYVIHATNAYASHLLPHYQVNRDRAIVPTRAQVIAVRPTQLKRLWTNAFSVNEGFDYLFQRPPKSKAEAGLVILGGGRNRAPPHYEFGVSDDSRLNDQVGDYLRGFLPSWFPKFWKCVTDVKVEDEWPGIMGFTKGESTTYNPSLLSVSFFFLISITDMRNYNTRS